VPYGKGIPGSHAEVHAANNLLVARPDAKVTGIAIHVINTENFNNSVAPAFDRCPNCARVVAGGRCCRRFAETRGGAAGTGATAVLSELWQPAAGLWGARPRGLARGRRGGVGGQFVSRGRGLNADPSGAAVAGPGCAGEPLGEARR